MSGAPGAAGSSLRISATIASVVSSRPATEAAFCRAERVTDQQPGHNGLAGAGFVGEQKAQRLTRQHGFVDGGDLVRQRLDQRGVCPRTFRRTINRYEEDGLDGLIDKRLAHGESTNVEQIRLSIRR